MGLALEIDSEGWLFSAILYRCNWKILVFCRCGPVFSKHVGTIF
jgi:hypothetical protein